MSLGTALAILGGVVLLALALQMWWQSRRSRPRTAPDSQLAADRVDPQMGSDGYAATQADITHDGPHLEEEPAALRVPPKKAPRLDALIDAIVPLSVEAPISGEMALAHLPPSRRAGANPSTSKAWMTRAVNGHCSAPANVMALCRPVCSWPTAAGR
jgi:hypothetical protein